MNNISQKLNELGIKIPEILLPAKINSKWPVIACDQYTQDREYWEKIKIETQGSPTALSLIFPEVYLPDGDAKERVSAIHKNMANYLGDGVFGAPRRGLVYIERDTPYQKGRRGLVAAIDLEKYDWHPEARPLIRSTEDTVQDRLPPRMDIRRGAPLELPHILLLIDDEADCILPELGRRVKKAEPAYNTELTQSAGSVTGWFLDAGSSADAEENMLFLADNLEKLRESSISRYGAPGGGSKPFLFAVGDGNHSLAAAKGIWEEYKTANYKEGVLPEPLCRYALVEIENIYDPAIQFEPIHRVVLGAEAREIIKLLSVLKGYACKSVNSREELEKLVQEPKTQNCFGIVSKEGGAQKYALIETAETGIATACLEPLLEGFVKTNPRAQIDYIHDEDEVFRIAENGKTVAGILLPPIQKAGLFETIARSGPLPRKSFSMGHSIEKRFYMECRALV